jgi:predicted DNA-binding transcriptional regulator AlpA
MDRPPNQSAAAPDRDPLSLIPLSAVTTIVGAGKSFIYDHMRAGRFPKPAIQRGRFTRWHLGEVQAWARDPASWLSRKEAM